MQITIDYSANGRWITLNHKELEDLGIWSFHDPEMPCHLLYPDAGSFPIHIHGCLSAITGMHIAMGIQNDFKIFLYSIYEKHLEAARARYWVKRRR